MALDTSKIIHAPIGGGKYTVTSPLTKSDYGIMLVIENAELPTSYQVDFSNNEHSGTSLTRIGGEDGVEIPKQFIDTGKDVFAWLYWVGEDYGKTVYKFRIPNKARPDRTNEEPTPTQQSVIDQAISALNSAVAQTAQDVIDADASAQASAESAQASGESALSASNSALSAGEYASNALGYAESASASATASAQSASQSAQIKADVEELVGDAQASASASAQSATASANSASQASGYAQSASQSATSAQGYASQAQTSANTASTKASEASTSASTASQKATESANSASLALTYKTDAESAKTASQTAQGLAESARDSAISAQESAEDARDEAQTLVDGISGKVEQIDANTADIVSLEEDRYKPYPTDTASGAIASFTDGADNIPLKSLIVDVNPVQDLHGYDSPWVAGGGKNKFGGEYGVKWFFPTPLELHAGDTFTVSASVPESGNTRFNAYVGESGATRIYNAGMNDTVNGRKVRTVTVNADVTYTAIMFDAAECTDIQFELGSSATPYAPYENICPISGWTGVNVTATSSNLRGGIDLANDIKARIASAVINTEEKTVSWGYNATHNAVYAPKVPFKENTRYTFIITAQNASKRLNFRIYYSDGSVQALPDLTTTGKETLAIVTSANKTVRTIVRQAQGGTTKLYYDESGIFEGVLTASDFQPFGQVIPISWQTEAGTVYGGKLDVLSGVLTVSKELLTLNGTSPKLTGKSADTEYGSALYFTGLGERKLFKNTISNMFSYSSLSYANMPLYSCIGGSGGAWTNHFIFPIGTTVEQGNAWFKEMYDNGIPVTILRTYETPVEIQLEPHEVASLLGVNNIFADTGDTACEYRADTRLYIEKLTQPEEDDMVADSAITSGQFFMVGNVLYRALANIASGATITVGTNAQRVSLADALNLINA